MRRTGHIRERSPGSFELRYSLGSDPASGKRKITTTTVRGTKKDADKELRRLLRSLDTGEHVDPNRITVREWLSTWLDAIRAEVAPKSSERYGEIVNNYLAPALGNLALAKLAPVHIQTAYNGWVTAGRRDGKPGGLSPMTRRHIHRILSSALSRAAEQQLISRNPCDAFKKRLPKIEHREIATLTAEQSQRLLSAIRHTRVYWPVLIALATGMRRGEILALRWRNVDLDRASLRVTETLEQTKAGLRVKAPKSGKARVITLPGFAIEELRRLKRQPRLRFHDLRHTHATQLLLAGVHPKIAQERLGHSTIAVTLDLYSHVTPTMQEDAAARIDAAFRGAIKGLVERK